MNKNEKGFGAIEALLLLLIVGLIGSVGFYVYKSQKATNRSLDNANKSLSDLARTNSRQAAEQNAAKEHESWLLYTSKDKTYSIRIPDGWDLLTVTPQENLHGRDTSSIVYKKGVKAKVTSVEGGWDGPSRFSLYVPGTYADQIVKQGVKQGELVTESGLKAEKYIYEESAEQEGIGYQKGDKVVNYYFGADGKNIQIEHVVSRGETSQLELIEKAIKTLKVN